MTTSTSRGQVRPPVITETGDPNRPITIGEGRAKIKRRKLTTTEFKDVRATAVAITGYSPTSPIYGKQLPEVIDLIEAELRAGLTAPAPLAITHITDAIALLDQLKARALTRKLIGQARS